MPRQVGLRIYAIKDNKVNDNSIDEVICSLLLAFNWTRRKTVRHETKYVNNIKQKKYQHSIKTVSGPNVKFERTT